MTTVTQAVRSQLVSAVNKPSEFKREANRKALRAAIDSAIEQITNQLLGPGARSREQMIKGLNQLIAKTSNDEIVKAVLAVLVDAAKLEALSYDEDGDRFESYVVGTLKPLIDLTQNAAVGLPRKNGHQFRRL